MASRLKRAHDVVYSIDLSNDGNISRKKKELVLFLSLKITQNRGVDRVTSETLFWTKVKANGQHNLKEHNKVETLITCVPCSSSSCSKAIRRVSRLDPTRFIIP